MHSCLNDSFRELQKSYIFTVVDIAFSSAHCIAIFRKLRERRNTANLSEILRNKRGRTNSQTTESKTITMYKLFALLFVVPMVYGRDFEIHPKIIKGIRSVPSNFPFYVNLVSPELDCGGSLISDTYVPFHPLHTK